MKFSELDVVRIKKDVPEKGIKKGDKGTIIVAFSKPHEAYEVEFWDNVYTPKQVVLLPDEIEKVEET
ncbi:DUF4926 domain-containing protein [Methanomethylovorans sp.]|uniref:DUF4926 domain-containing protein n=1 Tax=Methanomethylovorans sp. TaxID=2758717 RepID=UPI00351C85B2